MNYVIFHKSCYDGFGAAFVFWKYFGDRDLVEFIPMQHNDVFPEGLEPQSNVYIADFSFSPDVLLPQAKNFKKIVLLDHHKTAYEAWLQVTHLPENVSVEFDMNRSGALMAWDYLFPTEKAPLMIRHISDRDLWRFELENSEKFHVAIKSYPMDFEVWNTFLEQEVYVDLIAEGETLMRYENQMVASICKNARLETIGGYKVPVVSTSVAFSEVPNKLLELYPEAKFAVAYCDRSDGYRSYSLRSRKDFDCSEIAKKFGGGGHAQASGFRTAIPFLNLIE